MGSKGTTWLTALGEWQGMDRDFCQGMLRQNRLAVLSARVVHRFAEGCVHPRQLAQFYGLIDAMGSAGFLVNFLQSHDIGCQAFDDGGDTTQVGPAVRAFSVVDIVSQHT
jgi:hypothetical protein